MKSLQFFEWLLSQTFWCRWDLRYSIDAGLWLSQPGWHGSAWKVMSVPFRVLRCYCMPDAPIREQFYKEIDFSTAVQSYFRTSPCRLEESVSAMSAINEPGVVDRISELRLTVCQDAYRLLLLTVRAHACNRGARASDHLRGDLTINRAHLWSMWETVQRVRKLVPKAEIVSHLINGLPGETHDDVENVRCCDFTIFRESLHLFTWWLIPVCSGDYHEGLCCSCQSGRSMFHHMWPTGDYPRYRHPPYHRRRPTRYVDWSYGASINGKFLNAIEAEMRQTWQQARL